ncbi:GNAT family N-acetyltransferase [Halobacterium wangiae]|uniref:GNAT family N-acetyltransferase n=1 Tax=Halobacterium wangiae TaxID=2902623 RepID=UPI001E445807|nr:GNAT family protein [Halobacterium wangiae]
MFPDSITTDRLRLQRCCRDNVSVRELYAAASRRNDHIEEVTEHLSWNPHDSMKVSRDTLALFEEGWDDGEVATYAIRPREGEDGAGELAGTCGLTCQWDQDCATLGLWLRKRFWGRGYSGERADALLELAFDDLDLGVVAVTHHAGNENSERAIRKYVDANGGRREALLRHHGESPEGPVDEVRYTVSQAEWRAANGRE